MALRSTIWFEFDFHLSSAQHETRRAEGNKLRFGHELWVEKKLNFFTFIIYYHPSRCFNLSIFSITYSKARLFEQNVGEIIDDKKNKFMEKICLDLLTWNFSDNFNSFLWASRRRWSHTRHKTHYTMPLCDEAEKPLLVSYAPYSSLFITSSWQCKHTLQHNTS